MRETKCEILAGQWFYFQDSFGHGWAQPDYIVAEGNKVIIFECKLSENDVAFDQLSGLYLPLVEEILSPEETVLIQVCKRLRYSSAALVNSFAESMSLSTNSYAIWNWIP